MFDPMIGPLNLLSLAVPVLLLTGTMHLLDKRFNIFSKLVAIFDIYSYDAEDKDE